MNRVIGVDPGLSGAFAAVVWPAVLQVADTPTRTRSVNGKEKRVVDRAALQAVIRELVRAHRPEKVVIEDVHAMPRQGVTSAFTFGNVFGSIVQAFVAEGVSIELVPPALWKRRLGITADKATAFHEADRLFPYEKHWWSKKSQDGRAEAVLLAYYGLKFGGYR